jgi:alpha-ribazole phosphatase
MTPWTLSPGVTARLVLIRHGEPDETMRGRCYGSLDVSLSASGRLQMRRLRRWLLPAPIAAVYCSPHLRAVQSAHILAANRRLIPTVRDGLREIDFGAFEGLAFGEIAERFPTVYALWMTSPTDVDFPGGERFSDMVSRVTAAFEVIRKSHVCEAVAVVSHGGVNRIALSIALGLDLSRMFTLDQSYGAVNVIDYYGDTPLVRLVNADPAARC